LSLHFLNIIPALSLAPVRFIFISIKKFLKKFAATSPLVNQLTYFQKMASTRINNYLIDEHQDKLGEGQYGRVYRVRDTRMQGKTYALKLL
jgi:hypothetical protein